MSSSVMAQHQNHKNHVLIIHSFLFKRRLPWDCNGVKKKISRAVIYIFTWHYFPNKGCLCCIVLFCSAGIPLTTPPSVDLHGLLDLGGPNRHVCVCVSPHTSQDVCTTVTNKGLHQRCPRESRQLRRCPAGEAAQIVSQNKIRTQQNESEILINITRNQSD